MLAAPAVGAIRRRCTQRTAVMMRTGSCAGSGQGRASARQTQVRLGAFADFAPALDVFVASSARSADALRLWHCVAMHYNITLRAVDDMHFSTEQR